MSKAKVGDNGAATLEKAVVKARGKSFDNRADFDLALNASEDPNIVELDGVTVKGGELPVVAFVTKPDGQIVLKGD